MAASSRKNSPKRATTNPNPIIANPVRTQANSVRAKAVLDKYFPGVSDDKRISMAKSRRMPITSSSRFICFEGFDDGYLTFEYT